MGSQLLDYSRLTLRDRTSSIRGDCRGATFQSTYLQWRQLVTANPGIAGVPKPDENDMAYWLLQQQLDQYILATWWRDDQFEQSA